MPDAFDERGLPVIHLARVIEYDVPDRVGNGTGELIVLLTTILDPGGDDGARADELAAAYHQRWEQETANDQLKTHLRGPGRVLRSRLPDLVHQEIWAYLIVHHAISALTARASAAADLDPDRISFAQALRLIRRTATGTADIPPCRTGLTGSRPTWPSSPRCSSPPRRERTCPRAVKRARHNSYRVKKPGEPASTRHRAPATINIRGLTPEQHDQLRLRGIGRRPDGAVILGQARPPRPRLARHQALVTHDGSGSAQVRLGHPDGPARHGPDGSRRSRRNQ